MDASLPKIRRLRATPVNVPLARPHPTASGVVSSAPLVLMDLETDQGLTGHAYVFCYTPIALKPIAELIEALQPLIQGDTVAPLVLEAPRTFPLAWAARVHRDSHGGYQDRALIRAARGAAGKDLQIMVDYNQSLTVPEAIGRVHLLEEEALVWVEEPTRADDFVGHARIATECRTPIQIGGNLWGPHDLTKSLSVGASDFVMLDVMKIGGITGWLRAVSQAEAAGLPVSSHLFPELSAQPLALSPLAHWLEYQDWAAPILERPLELKDGFALPQKEAGGGLVWDKDAVERYRVC